MKKTAILTLALVLLLILGGGLYYLYACEDDWCMHFEWQKGEKTFTEEIEERKNIIVTKPLPGEEVGFPLIIEGKASTFESTVNYRIRDEDNSILLEHFTTAETIDLGVLAPFHADVFYPEPEGKSGTVEVFEYSAADGSESALVRIPVTFQPVETQTIKVFFR